MCTLSKASDNNTESARGDRAYGDTLKLAITRRDSSDAVCCSWVRQRDHWHRPVHLRNELRVWRLAHMQGAAAFMTMDPRAWKGLTKEPMYE